MLTWIKKLLLSEHSVQRRVEGLERKIIRIALYPYGDTQRQISAIMKATELKRQTLLFARLARKLKKGLTDEELTILRMFNSGKTACEIAEKFGWNRQMAYRKTHASVKSAENVLFLLGYDLETLAEQFYLLR